MEMGISSWRSKIDQSRLKLGCRVVGGLSYMIARVSAPKQSHTIVMEPFLMSYACRMYLTQIRMQYIPKLLARYASISSSFPGVCDAPLHHDLPSPFNYPASSSVL